MAMSERDREEPLAARARAQLDQDVDSLDETTRARLRAARLRALDAHGERRRFALPRGLLAATAGAVALFLVVSSWRQQARRDLPLGEDLDDVEILAAADDLELYDDLDFYRWLAQDGAL